MKGKRGLLIALACALFLASILFFLWEQGVIVADHSAEYTGDLHWNGRVYTSITDCPFKAGWALAKTCDGNWTVYALKEDPSHTFVLVSSFLDQHLLVVENYNIPKTGRITKAVWNRESISDEAFINAVSAINGQKSTSFEYETDGIFVLNEFQCMKELYFAYEDCPLATEYAGFLGKIHGQWVITTGVSQRNEDGSPKAYGLYVIPEEFHSVLEQYFFE